MRRFAMTWLAGLAVAALPASLAAGASAPAPKRCTAGELAATFAHVPDSDATGHELYRLRIVTHAGTCALKGRLKLQLLAADGSPVATHVSGSIVVRTVTSAGTKIYLELSPDLYGPGEPATGPCEPVAHRLRVTSSAGRTVAAVTPPTPVCRHGAMTVINAGEAGELQLTG
jgi:hypothetical protein